MSKLETIIANLNTVYNSENLSDDERMILNDAIEDLRQIQLDGEGT